LGSFIWYFILSKGHEDIYSKGINKIKGVVYFCGVVLYNDAQSKFFIFLHWLTFAYFLCFQTALNASI